MYFLEVAPSQDCSSYNRPKIFIFNWLNSVQFFISSLRILAHLFGMNQLINGKKYTSQVLITSTIKYSSSYLITLYFGFLLIISVSQSNNYHFLLITNSHSYIIVSVSKTLVPFCIKINIYMTLNI